MRCGLPVARNENVAKYKDYGLAFEELTIPELLRPAGHRSLMVGKWHLGLEVEGSHPLDAGFDEHLGIPSNYEPKRGKHHDTLYRGMQIEQQKVRCQELTRRYTDEVVDFIGRQEDNPFFIYVSHHIVHSPLLPSKDSVGTSMKGKYGDFIKELDHSTGRIMKAIRDAGLDDNTLVVFTSDTQRLCDSLLQRFVTAFYSGTLPVLRIRSLAIRCGQRDRLHSAAGRTYHNVEQVNVFSVVVLRQDLATVSLVPHVCLEVANRLSRPLNSWVFRRKSPPDPAATEVDEDHQGRNGRERSCDVKLSATTDATS